MSINFCDRVEEKIFIFKLNYFLHSYNKSLQNFIIVFPQRVISL